MLLIETSAAITAISEYFNTLAGTGYTGHESAGIPKAIEDILNALPPAPAVSLETSKNIKLKPCPFCGGEAKFESLNTSAGPGAQYQIYYQLSCSICNLRWPGHHSVYISYNPLTGANINDKELKEAAEKWNNRK